MRVASSMTQPIIFALSRRRSAGSRVRCSEAALLGTHRSSCRGAPIRRLAASERRSPVTPARPRALPQSSTENALRLATNHAGLTRYLHVVTVTWLPTDREMPKTRLTKELERRSLRSPNVRYFRHRFAPLVRAGVVVRSGSRQRRCRRYHCARAPY